MRNLLNHNVIAFEASINGYPTDDMKIAKFSMSHIGPLGGYRVAVDHQLCNAGDHIEIQYALETITQPIGISEYMLEQFPPLKRLRPNWAE